MRGKARYLFGRTVSLLPSVLVAAGWIVIWFLWPRPVAGGLRRLHSITALSLCRVSAADKLYRNPDLFGPASPLGFSPPGSDGNAWRTPWSRQPPRPFQLARTPDTGRTDLETATAWPPGPRVPAYAPEFGRVSAYPPPAQPPAAVRVRPAPGLAAAGFALPEFPSSGELPDQWETEATVELDARGRVGAVFVTRGSGHPRVDRTVEGWLARASVTNRGERLAGTVVVSRSP